jgi:hypothetical protein
VAESGTVASALVPLNDSAVPTRPAAQVAPDVVPALLLPDASANVVPAPSSKL